MDFNKIDDQIRQYVEKNEMAGGALIIRREGKLLYKNKWGYADIKKKIPVEYNTLFKMASVSKVFTAIGVLKLIESGKLGLDDPITKYLPEFHDLQVVSDERFSPEKFSLKKMLYYLLTVKEGKVKTLPAVRDITVRDLLTHSSGIEMGLVGVILTMKMKGTYKDTLETRVKKWANFPLDFQPGSSTGYSGRGGFDVLARLCEVVSKKPFSVYMQDEIFSPLNMEACFALTEEKKSRVPRLYKTVRGKHKDATGTSADINKIGLIGPNYTSGSAGVYATVEDMDKIASMLASEGELDGVRILNPDTVKSIYTECAYDKNLEFAPGLKWGLGMMVREDPKKAGITTKEGTFGWSGAFGTHLFVTPSDKLAVSFAMNRADIGGASSYIIRRLEELIFE